MPKNKQMLTGCAGIFLIAIAIAAGCAGCSPETPKLSPAEQRKQDSVKRLESIFSAWDGAPIKLKKHLREHMNDASSFEHVEARYWVFKDHIVILEKFRGNNAYGAKVLQFVKAKCTLDGDVIEVMDAIQPDDM